VLDNSEAYEDWCLEDGDKMRLLIWSSLSAKRGGALVEWMRKWSLGVLALGVMCVALVVAKSKRMLLAGLVMLLAWALARVTTAIENRRYRQEGDVMQECR
jgi:hypothetical protein